MKIAGFVQTSVQKHILLLSTSCESLMRQIFVSRPHTVLWDVQVQAICALSRGACEQEFGNLQIWLALPGLPKFLAGTS
jgi:hypothetical protein